MAVFDGIAFLASLATIAGPGQAAPPSSGPTFVVPRVPRVAPVPSRPRPGRATCVYLTRPGVSREPTARSRNGCGELLPPNCTFIVGPAAPDAYRNGCGEPLPPGCTLLETPAPGTSARRCGSHPPELSPPSPAPRGNGAPQPPASSVGGSPSPAASR